MGLLYFGALPSDSDPDLELRFRTRLFPSLLLLRKYPGGLSGGEPQLLGNPISDSSAAGVQLSARAFPPPFCLQDPVTLQPCVRAIPETRAKRSLEAACILGQFPGDEPLYSPRSLLGCCSSRCVFAAKLAQISVARVPKGSLLVAVDGEEKELGERRSASEREHADSELRPSFSQERRGGVTWCAPPER